MPSNYGQANWFIFDSWVRFLNYTRTISLKGKRGGGRNGGTRGGWTGFGVTGAQWATIIIVVSVAGTALTLTGALSWLASAIANRPGPGITSALQTLPAGYGYCPGTTGPGPGGSWQYGSQPSNCLPIGMNLQISLRNGITSNACGANGNCGGGSTAWSVQLIWGSGNQVVGGTSPGIPGTIAETIANVGSNGNAVSSQQLYYPTWALSVKICHQATACGGSGSYGQQEYTSVLPFPGGTVPFYYGTQAPTTTWTQPVTAYIVPMAGDIAASNTPVTMLLQAQNGTALSTSTTGAVNSASAPAGDKFYFGSGVYINTFTVTLTNTYTTTTFPYGAGYTPIATDPTLNLPGLGSLTTNLQLEVKQTGGSNPICTVAAGGGTYGFSLGPYIKAASVPDAIYATPDLSTALTVNRISGYQSNSVGSVQIPFVANCQTLTAGSHADTDSFTWNLYAYYSVSWVSANSGTLNTITAVTQMSQYTVTITS